MKRLLDNGADVNASDRSGSRIIDYIQANWEVPSYQISEEGRKKALEGQYANALQAAASSGNIETVRLLLERGANVNDQGGDYGYALRIAANHHFTDIVRLLLDNGADIHLQGGSHGTALQVAAGCPRVMDSDYQDLSTLKLLLDRGANINAWGSGTCGTALIAAAWWDWEIGVRHLVQRGVQINLRGCGKHINALDAAMRMQR